MRRFGMKSCDAIYFSPNLSMPKAVYKVIHDA